jgi:hypothetical protein
MDHFAGLDVSVKDTSICIVDDTGRIVREVKVLHSRLLAIARNDDVCRRLMTTPVRSPSRAHQIRNRSRRTARPLRQARARRGMCLG